MYYIAGYEEKVALSSVSLDDRKTAVIMFLPKLFEKSGPLSVSPNGKMVLVRGIIKDELGYKKQL